MTIDDAMSQAVRECRCNPCNGNGFKLRKIEGLVQKFDCPDCNGNGVHLQSARRRTRELLQAE